MKANKVYKPFDEMAKVATHGNYNYWQGWSEKGPFYNITPIDQEAPMGGYYAKEYILGIKKVPDLFQ